MVLVALEALEAVKITLIRVPFNIVTVLGIASVLSPFWLSQVLSFLVLFKLVQSIENWEVILEHADGLGLAPVGVEKAVLSDWLHILLQPQRISVLVQCHHILEPVHLGHEATVALSDSLLVELDVGDCEPKHPGI